MLYFALTYNSAHGPQSQHQAGSDRGQVTAQTPLASIHRSRVVWASLQFWGPTVGILKGT